MNTRAKNIKTNNGKSLLFWRRCSQFCIALVFIILPFINSAHLNWAYGNFLAFAFGPVPFADPLAVAQVSAITFSITNAMLLGAGLALLLALFLGSVFCSWVCPFGLLSELQHSAIKANKSAQAQKSLAKEKSAKASTVQARQTYWGFGFFIKLSIVITGIALCLLLISEPFMNQLSLPGWYSRIWQAVALQEWATVATGSTVLVLVLLLDFITKKRIWCRYLCPQSVLISLARLCSPKSLGVKFIKEQCSCKGSRPCQTACSLDLLPRANSTWQHLSCTNCGQCITTCSKYGKALSFSFDSAFKKSKNFGKQ